MGSLGWQELVIVLVIVVIIFGVGKLPEIGGAMGKGIREFRSNATDPEEEKKDVQTTTTTTVKEEL